MPPRPAVPRLLTAGPFRRQHALACGLSDDHLASRTWRRLLRDVYVHRDVDVTPWVKAQAAMLVAPAGAVLSGTTAAWVHGVDVRPHLDEPPQITVPRGRAVSQRSGLLRVRQAELAAADVCRVRDVAVTTPVRTAFDLARLADPVTAVATLDGLWRLGLTSPEDLTAYAGQTRHRGLRGVRSVGYAVAQADRRAENAGESRLRMLLVRGGLPCPEPQLVVRDAHGVFVARVDLGYEAVRLAIELDGRAHDERAVRLYDARRHNQLVALGWTVLRFGGPDLRLPAVLCRTVARELVRLAGVPLPVLSPMLPPTLPPMLPPILK